MGSPYLARQLAAHPEWQDFVQGRHDWLLFDFAGAWRVMREGAEVHEDALLRDLRLFRHRHACVLVAARLRGEIGERVFVEALSALAAALIDAAMDWHFHALAARYGYPCHADGRVMRMTVLGMGKLGGRELNFSSDVDLIFVYAQGGETSGPKVEAHEVFFRKLAQKLIYSLDTVTADGFCYRVDMRLRPFGQTGPLALNHEAMEQYYQMHGRDWERYAMMKARPVAGDIEGGFALLEALKPFMYRRYLDYAALGSITEMKQSINRQIRSAGMENHIKLGAGGIREVEFSVQAMQMIYGGQYPRLQTPSFFTVLENLGALGFWPEEAVAQLRKDYLLLRTVENALQFQEDKQVHSLPDSGDNESWQALATACHYADAAVLRDDLQAARRRVQRWFDNVFAGEDSVAVHEALTRLDWRNQDGEALEALLLAQGMEVQTAQLLAGEMAAFAERLPWARLSDRTARRIENLVPQMLTLISEHPHYAQGFAGVARLVEAVSRREVYVGMLAEQQTLLAHLLAIAASSKWLMDFICEHPLVLDEVLSERNAAEEVAHLSADLDARLDGVADDET